MRGRGSDSVWTATCDSKLHSGGHGSCLEQEDHASSPFVAGAIVIPLIGSQENKHGSGKRQAMNMASKPRTECAGS